MSNYTSALLFSLFLQHLVLLMGIGDTYNFFFELFDHIYKLFFSVLLVSYSTRLFFFLLFLFLLFLGTFAPALGITDRYQGKTKEQVHMTKALQLFVSR